MTLEEIEKLVRAVVKRNLSVKFGDPRYTCSINSQELRMLCEVLVAILPVVMVADRWHSSRLPESRRLLADLHDAIDDMRSALAE